MESTLISICSLIFLLIIFIFFITKPKIQKLENQLFFWLMTLNIVGLVLEILSYVFICNIPNFYNSFFYILFLKLVFSYYILWEVIFVFYIIVISFSVSYSDLSKYKQKLLLFLSIGILSLVTTLLLPINIVHMNGLYYPTGPAMISMTTGVLFGVMVVLYCVLKNIKRIIDLKYLPLLFYIVFGSIGIAWQMIDPTWLLVTPIETLVIVLMYFTIENPDIKMLNQVSAAKEAADKANQAKSDFLSSMSHEIRTPLNAIVGFSECIKNADSLEEAKENASDIVTASESLLEIVNGILDISKIESGKLELVQSDYDIYKILDEVVKLIKARLGDKPLNFEVNIAEDIPHVLYGDHFNIKKILINFLTNAVKYTDEGFIKFDVKCVKVNNDVCRLIMSVKDSGRGIKKEDIDKLFNKFQRLDEDKNTTIEGTGLGLAITKQLVEMMHGKIVVNSIYGEGSEFTVALDQRISNVVLETEETVVETELDLSGKKVLVVDDNKLNLKVAIKLLQPYKCLVETCESGFGCIDKITSGNKYDIILLDDMMPKMRGSETLTRLKSDPKFNIPVIALTANAIQGMREQYLLLGFDDYLAKPIEKTELFRVLKKFVLKEDEPKIEPKNEEHATIEESKEEIEIDYHDYTGKKVLIVDDNKLNIKVASKIMMPYHFDIDSVYSGVECLDKVKTTKYDIIFMDYMMPNMDGIETFNRLHEIPGFSTPVISLTADAVVGAREKFMEAGFNGYVSKPIDKKKLDEAINKALNNQ